MKRFMVLVIGLVFLCSTVAFAAEGGKKEKGKKGAPAVTEPAAAPAEKKEEKKVEKKAAKKVEKKAAKKVEKKAAKKAPQKGKKEKKEEAPAAK